MHVIDLGTAGVLAGGVCKYVLLATDVPLESLWQLVQLAYRLLKTSERLDFLGPGTFLKDARAPGSAHWPVWRPKAAKTRHFIPALLYAFSRLPLAWDNFEKAMLEALKALTAFYGELEPQRSQLTLPPQCVRALRDHTHTFLRTMQWLSERQSDLFFNITPKLHYMKHLAEEASVVNPMWVTTYAEEDLVGKVIKICHASSQGHKQSQLSRLFLQRYRCYLCLLLGGYQ
jgi:hypothetical protein